LRFSIDDEHKTRNKECMRDISKGTLPKDIFHHFPQNAVYRSFKREDYLE
jgi:hypothetical protein